jgi:hypothetical protein
MAAHDDESVVQIIFTELNKNRVKYEQQRL